MRELLSVLVETAGIGRVVAVASDGIEAVELSLTRSPEVALLDVEMPRLTGLAAAEAIRSARPETQIVLHTGQDDPEVRARARSLEIPLVSKITDAEVLASTIAGTARSGLPMTDTSSCSPARRPGLRAMFSSGSTAT